MEETNSMEEKSLNRIYLIVAEEIKREMRTRIKELGGVHKIKWSGQDSLKG